MDKSRRKICLPGLVRSLKLLFVLFVGCASAACTAVGPDYVRPDLIVEAAWQTEAETLQSDGADESLLASWWETFEDPVLNSLMDRAVAGNLNLQSALSTVRQARISRGISDADRYPSVNASGSVRRSYQNDMSGDFTGSTSYGLGLDASWELDIFGGVRRSLEASDAQLAATEESCRDVLVSLLAEVALDYVELRAYQARLQVAEANLASQEETWQITKWRHQAGLATALDVELATSNLEQTRSNIPSLKAGIRQTLNALSVLVGMAPGKLASELETYQPIPQVPETISMGIPADLLRRRPDLRKAERELAAQSAQIGVAKSKLYPSISLSGSIGLDALSAGDLLESDSLGLGLGSVVSWPVYKAGAILRNIELQYEIQEQNLIGYQQALLNALADVENGLTSISSEKDSRASLVAACRAAESAVEMSKAQYSSGLVDFTTVLDSERTLLSLQNQVTQSDAQMIKNIITLYKALGGGWENNSTEGS